MDLEDYRLLVGPSILITDKRGVHSQLIVGSHHGYRASSREVVLQSLGQDQTRFQQFDATGTSVWDISATTAKLKSLQRDLKCLQPLSQSRAARHNFTWSP
jgi:hypothetical protein